VRYVLTFVMLMVAASAAVAGDSRFSLNIATTPPASKSDPRKEARLAEWNSPMGRLMHSFNQQQAWMMRGTMPGGERVNGLAVRVKAQGGLPLHLLAATMQASTSAVEQQIAVVQWPWSDEEKGPVMALDEQLSLLLGNRLSIKH